MTISGVYSQNRLVNSDGGFITNAERDSAYFKIQRGNINAEKVVILNGALKTCDSIKSLYVIAIGLQEVQLSKKDDIIANDKIIITTLKETVKLEVKRGRRKGFWNFLKGMTAGAILGAGFVIAN